MHIYSEALNMLGRFKRENPHLPIIAEFAKERDPHAQPAFSGPEHDFLFQNIKYKDEPFQSVLEMDKRYTKTMI